mmetsp:Transcript_16978/g.33151  ORF Transcript_16978/g.33151 Transcript_16978/m.33151 type:complete len:1202 (-) Transcript_16978:1580-5185(-)
MKMLEKTTTESRDPWEERVWWGSTPHYIEASPAVELAETPEQTKRLLTSRKRLASSLREKQRSNLQPQGYKMQTLTGQRRRNTSTSSSLRSHDSNKHLHMEVKEDINRITSCAQGGDVEFVAELRRDLRCWARASRLISPWFAWGELEKVLNDVFSDAQEDSKTSIKPLQSRSAWIDRVKQNAELSIVRTAMEESEAREVLACKRTAEFQAIATLPIEFMHDSVASLLTDPAVEKAFVSLFSIACQESRLEFTSTIRPGTFPGVCLTSFLQTLQGLNIPIKAGEAARCFRQSMHALSPIPISTRALCWPEFVEALLRCSSSHLQSSQNIQFLHIPTRAAVYLTKRVSSYFKKLQSARNRKNSIETTYTEIDGNQADEDIYGIEEEESKEAERNDESTISVYERLIRSRRNSISSQSSQQSWASIRETPRGGQTMFRVRSASAEELCKWPFVRQEQLEKLLSNIEAALEQPTPSLVHNATEELQKARHCGVLDHQDAYIVQELLPSLQRLITAILGQEESIQTILRETVTLVESLPYTSASMILGEHPWLAEKALRDAVMRNCGPLQSWELEKLLLDLAGQGKHPHANTIADALLQNDQRKSQALIPLFLSRVAHPSNTNFTWQMRTLAVFCLGMLARRASPSHLESIVSAVDRALLSGEADLRYSAWALRQCKNLGIQKLWYIATNFHVYSAHSRCCALEALNESIREFPGSSIQVATTWSPTTAVTPELSLFDITTGVDKATPVIEIDELNFEKTINSKLMLQLDVRSALNCLAAHLPAQKNILQGVTANRNVENDTSEDCENFPASVSICLRALAHDPEIEVQACAAKVLGGLLSQSENDSFFTQTHTIVALCKACEHPEDLVREAAIIAVGQMASRFMWVAQGSSRADVSAAHAAQFAQSCVKCLENALQDHKWKIRHAATHALEAWAPFCGSRTISCLAEGLRRGRFKSSEAGSALAEMGNDGIKALVLLVQDPNISSQSRAAAIRGLTRLREVRPGQLGERAVDVLFAALLQDTSANVRVAAVETLATLSQKMARSSEDSNGTSLDVGYQQEVSFKLSVRVLHPVLHSALEDPAECVARAAAQALAAAEPEGGLLLLRAALQSRFARTRRVAGEALALQGVQNLKTLLLMCLGKDMRTVFFVQSLLEKFSLEDIRKAWPRLDQFGDLIDRLLASDTSKASPLFYAWLQALAVASSP